MRYTQKRLLIFDTGIHRTHRMAEEEELKCQLIIFQCKELYIYKVARLLIYFLITVTVSCCTLFHIYLKCLVVCRFPLQVQLGTER